jgi:signal peptidase
MVIYRIVEVKERKCEVIVRFNLYLHHMRSKSRVNQVRKAIFIAIALSAAILPAILTSQFGYGFSPILTGSMRPAANPGDVYITRLVSASEVAVGDVIAVNNQVTGTYYSHRVEEIRNLNGTLRITTHGDANEAADREPYMVSPIGTISRVQFRIPAIGRPLVYLNTVQGRQLATSFLIIANILTLFGFLFRKKIVASFTPERVYRELYMEERRSSQQYRELFDNLQDSLAIERENKTGSTS